MAAVHLPDAVVASSTGAPTPNPITPIFTPVDIVAVNNGALSVPVTVTPENSNAINTPIIVTAESVSSINTPVIFGSQGSGSVPIPVIVTPESVAAINTPVINTAVSVASVATPIINTAVSAPATATPVIVNSVALPASNPPYALNHARILYDSLLIGSSVATSAGANGNLVLVPNTADRWAFTAGGSITFTLPTAVNMDSVAIGAHNLGSTSHVVSVEYSSSDAGAFSTFKANQTPADDTAMMFHNTSSVSVRRLKITCTGSGSAFVGSIYAGIALQMQRPFFAGHAPINLSAKTIRYSSTTEGGNFVGEQIRRLGFSTSASFSNLENDWYRFYFQPFVIHARTLPFYFAWNLNQYSTDVGYCKTSEDISPSYGTRDLFNVSFDMVGFG